MTDDWTREIKERLEKATPGKWEADGFDLSMEESGYHCRMLEDDANFIAHAPTDIANLIKEREVLREALKMVVEYCPATCETGFEPDMIYGHKEAREALAYDPTKEKE